MDDAHRIERFLTIAYGNRAHYKYPLRWLWEYAHNPFWTGNRLPVWIAESGGEIVGQACVMSTQFQMDSHLVSAGWGTDFIVLPDYRKKGIGKALIKAHTADFGIFIALSMSPFTARELKALGFQETEPVAVLCKKLDQHSMGSSRNARKNSSELAPGTFSSFCRSILSRVSFRSSVRDKLIDSDCEEKISFESIHHFGPEFDSFWNKVSSGFAAVVPRNAAYLNWKFCEQPHLDYQRIAVKSEGILKGYCIFRWESNAKTAIGVISDVLVDPADRYLLAEVTGHALGMLHKNKVKAVFAASSHPAYIECFMNLGFDKVEEKIPLFRAQGDSAGLIQGIPRGWLLSKSDHDWDQYLSLLS